jgi:hypothetical protein
MDTSLKDYGNVLKMLGDSMKNMKKFVSKDIKCQVQEAVVLLQYKIYLHTHLLMGLGTFECPMYLVRNAFHEFCFKQYCNSYNLFGCTLVCKLDRSLVTNQNVCPINVMVHDMDVMEILKTNQQLLWVHWDDMFSEIKTMLDRLKMALTHYNDKGTT